MPLVRISSDSSERKWIKNQTFNSYFPESFALWLGIKAENFKSYSDIFSEISQTEPKNFKNLIKDRNDKAIEILK